MDNMREMTLSRHLNKVLQDKTRILRKHNPKYNLGKRLNLLCNPHLYHWSYKISKKKNIFLQMRKKRKLIHCNDPRKQSEQRMIKFMHNKSQALDQNLNIDEKRKLNQKATTQKRRIMKNKDNSSELSTRRRNNLMTTKKWKAS